MNIMELMTNYDINTDFFKELEEITLQFKQNLSIGNTANAKIFENLSYKYFEIYNKISRIYLDNQKIKLLELLDKIYFILVERDIAEEITHLYSVFQNQSNLTIMYNILRNRIISYTRFHKIENKLPMINIDIRIAISNIKIMAKKARDYAFLVDKEYDFEDYISTGTNNSIENLPYTHFKTILTLLSNNDLKYIFDIINRTENLCPKNYKEKQEIITNTKQKIENSSLPCDIKKLLIYGLLLMQVELRVRNIIANKSPEIIGYRNQLSQIINCRTRENQDTWYFQNCFIKVYKDINGNPYKLHDNVSTLYNNYKQKIYNDKELKLIISNL